VPGIAERFAVEGPEEQTGDQERRLVEGPWNGQDPKRGKAAQPLGETPVACEELDGPDEASGFGSHSLPSVVRLNRRRNLRVLRVDEMV
jgi:hypothetical protein